jgi:hypothetical protein
MGGYFRSCVSFLPLAPTAKTKVILQQPAVRLGQFRVDLKSEKENLQRAAKRLVVTDHALQTRRGRNDPGAKRWSEIHKQLYTLLGSRWRPPIQSLIET